MCAHFASLEKNLINLFIVSPALLAEAAALSDARSQTFKLKYVGKIEKLKKIERVLLHRFNDF